MNKRLLEWVSIFTVSLLSLVTPVLGSAAPEASYSPALGQARVYQLSLQGSAEVNYVLLAAAFADVVPGQSQKGNRGSRGLDAELQEVTYDLRAELHLRVLLVEGAEVTVAARLQEVRYEVNGGEDARRELLEMPFLLHFDQRGAMVKWEFAQHFPDELSRAIRGLIEPMQIVLPDNSQSETWKTREHSADSSYRAVYKWLGIDEATGLARINKRKVSVVALPNAAEDLTLETLEHQRVYITESNINATWSLRSHAVERVAGSETTERRAGSQFISRNRQSFVAQRVDTPLAVLATNLSRARSALRSPEFLRARLYDTDPRVAQTVKGLTVDAMMNRFFEQSAKNDAAAHRLLKNYLRIYPQRSLAVALWVNELVESPTEYGVGFAWAALASAGHTEAQEVLLKVVTDDAWSADSREKALLAMMDLEFPLAHLPAQVWDFRQGIERTSPEAEMLLSMATNVFGALGDVRKGNDEITGFVVAALERQLGRVHEPREISWLLDGLSNVGDLQRVAPVASAAFSSPHDGVRARAFTTFRRMPGEAAFALFAKRFSEEPSAKVRRLASRTGLQMASSDARNDWARNQAFSSSDVEVILLAVKILGLGLTEYSDNEQVLRQLLATHRDRQIRRQIYAHVSPARKGAK